MFTATLPMRLPARRHSLGMIVRARSDIRDERRNVVMFEVDALTHSHALTYRRHGDCDTLSHQIFGPCSSVLGHWNALYA